MLHGPPGAGIFLPRQTVACSTGKKNTVLTVLMAEIKFRCPECEQKIAVEASAAGVKIDCPTCHSQLTIPRTATDKVAVNVRRKLAIVGGSADEFYAELQKAQAQAAKATDELNQVRGKQEAALQEFKKDVDSLRSAKESLEKEATALRPVREELTAVKKSLAEATAREAQSKAAAASAAALRAELTGLQATHAETQSRLANATEQLAALQCERDQFAKTAADATELREQLADARKDIARATKDAETSVAAHAAQLDAARGIETGVRAELASMQTQHSQVQSRLEEHAGRVAELEAGRTELTEVIEELLPLREELEKSQREVCNICESAAEKARGYESRLEAAKDSESALRASFGDLQARHEAAQKQNAEQAGRLEVAVKRVAELQQETAAAKQLREQLAGSQGELDRLRKEMAEAAKERDKAARKDEDTLSKARAAEKTLREYGEGLNAKLADAEKRLAAFTHGFTAIKQENTDLTAELRVMRKERDDAAALGAGHAKELGSLKPALESAKGESTRLREAADAAAAEKARITAALEKAGKERSEALEGNRQQAASTAAQKKEIERLTKLVETAEAAAKKSAPLPQPPASLRKSADSKALSELERLRTENTAALESAKQAGRDATERAKKSDEERAGLAAELSRKSAEFDSLKDEAARVKAELDQLRSQPKEAPIAQPTPTATAAPGEREKALEAERDALAAALERAKQHVGVLQARRDMLRDEVATLRTRLGIGGKITSGDEKPIAK